MNMAKYWQLFFILLCAWGGGRFSVAISRPSSIVLENNEFKHILVAIDDNVADNPTLLQNIKNIFTKASAILYEATDHRAVFRYVTILVPASWSNVNNAYVEATSQILSNADVIFTSPLSSAPPAKDEPERYLDDHVGVQRVRSVPEGSVTLEKGSLSASPPAMTKVYAGCGHQGVRVTLTTDIVTNTQLIRSLGPPEKVLVHEWAHFRWGVFDEYGLDGEPQFYFSPKTGKLEGVRCTELIQGIISRINPATGRQEYCRTVDNTTGLYADGCKFMPYYSGPNVNGIEASIMDHVNIPPMSKFCNDNDSNSRTRHNYDAPSRHNRLCGHRSTWDVISHTEDFANGANPRHDGLNTTPVFNVVQAHRTQRVLLVLDTSASMADDHKLTRMKQAAASTFIQAGLAPGTEVGLATFSDNLQLKRALQTLNSTQARQSFSDDFPDTQSGATDITLALTSCIQVFQDSKASPKLPQISSPATSAFNSSILPSHHGGVDHLTPSHNSCHGHMVVVTDGQQTSGTNVMSALPALQNAGLIVSFIVLGTTPLLDLEIVAQSTGGRIYYDRNHHSSTSATDALFDVMTSTRATPKDSSVQILNRAEGLAQGQTLKGEFFLDGYLGIKTTVVIAYDVTLPSVTVTSPLGRVYSRIFPEYSQDDRLKMAKINIPFKAEMGRWKYEVSNPGGFQRVSLLVLSSSSNSSVPPVTLTGLLMPKKKSKLPTIHVFAEAMQGHNPVKGLRVTAHISIPDGATELVELLDNGAGADIVENDGVYSRYYSKLSEPGVYTVQLSALGNTDDAFSAQAEYITQSNYMVQRSASAGQIVVRTDDNDNRGHAGTGNQDTEAPVRISDLRVVKTSSKNRTVVLSWRASGDDNDHDTASHYEMFVAPTTEDLITGTSQVTNLTQEDMLHGNLVEPNSFGTREFFMVRIPDTLLFANAGSFVFTVVAVDKAGNRGEHSNYVTVGLGKVPDVTDHRYWKEGQFEPVGPQLNAPKSQRLDIAILLGTVSTLLVLVIILTSLVAFCKRKQVVVSKKKNPAESDLSYIISKCERGKIKTDVFALS